VKTTQKTKKCLRCNHIHKVQNLLRKSEIVKGMTEAVERVKMLQNELAQKELGRSPDLVSERGFSLVKTNDFIQTSVNRSIYAHIIEGAEDNYTLFLEMLVKINARYKKFPRYLIDIMAKSSGIPLSEIPSLIRKALREERLFQKKDLYSV
jgi:hypothetical protein